MWVWGLTVPVHAIDDALCDLSKAKSSQNVMLNIVSGMFNYQRKHTI